MSHSKLTAVPHHSAPDLRKFRASLAVRPFFHQVRKVLPVLFTLAIATVAHAQGTMDFSGAQTLMGTFNMGTSTIQEEVVFPDSVQMVPEKTVGSIGGKRVHVTEFEHHAEHRVLSGTTQIGQKIFCLLIASCVESLFALRSRLRLPMELPNVVYPFNNLVALNELIQQTLLL